MLVAIVASFVGALIVATLASPRYEATSRIMLGLLKPDPVTGQMVVNPKSLGTYIGTQSEIIRDYGVTAPVVEQLGWLSDPGRIRAYEARPASDTRDFRRWLAQQVGDRTRVNLASGEILQITFSSSNPAEAKVAAEALRTAYIETSLRSRREAASRNAAWWNEQAELLRKKAEQAELAKANYERDNGIVMEGASDMDSERLRALAGQAAVVPFVPAQTASAASLQLAQIDAQIQQQSMTLGANHPVMQELAARRNMLSGIVAQEQAAARQASTGEVRAAAVNRELQSQTSRVLAQRESVERLRQLAAQVQLLRDQYRKTAARAADLTIEAAVADSGMTPLGVVVTPTKPSFPNKQLMLGGALGLGAALGLMLALLVELLNRRVRGVEDLEGALDIPCLAVIRTQEATEGVRGLVRALLPRRAAA